MIYGGFLLIELFLGFGDVILEQQRAFSCILFCKSTLYPINLCYLWLLYQRVNYQGFCVNLWLEIILWTLDDSIACITHLQIVNDNPMGESLN